MSTSVIRTTAKVQSLRAVEKTNEGPGVEPTNFRLSGQQATSSSGHLARAVALHLSGKREEAVEQLRRAVAGKEATPEIYRAMGHILFEMEEYAESANSYRTLVRLKPGYAMGWLNLGVCFERTSEWEDAAEAFQKACELTPKNLDAHLGLGVCRLRLEDPKSALFAFEHCLELAPDHEDGLFGKAAALQALGHSDEAAGATPPGSTAARVARVPIELQAGMRYTTSAEEERG
jgi:tetratricopeptide (TPR) repeat protein